MIWVTDAKHLGGYRLWVRFSDASEGDVDLGELVLNDKRQTVAALRDPAVFAAMRVDMDTVVWNNGFDLAPEYLHARAKAATAAQSGFAFPAGALLARLKAQLVIDWRHKATARSQLKLAIEDTLDTGLPRADTPELYKQKCSAVFEHVYESYPGRGAEVCATAP